MSDAVGLVQFLRALSEIARGAEAPSVKPVWGRDLIAARDPPRVTCAHDPYRYAIPIRNRTLFQGSVNGLRSFFFSQAKISLLRQYFVPQHFRDCTTFELLVAVLWISRTKAMKYDREQNVYLVWPVNARDKFNPPLPTGYYGNALVYAAAKCRAGDLIQNPVGETLELIRRAKNEVNETYVSSFVDFIVTNGRSIYSDSSTTFGVVDETKAGFENVDFGWGKAVYGGVADVNLGPSSFFMASMNVKGERGILVPVCLPAPAMDLFAETLDIMFDQVNREGGGKSLARINSAL